MSMRAFYDWFVAGPWGYVYRRVGRVDAWLHNGYTYGDRDTR
jgi:hypothetical protein